MSAGIEMGITALEGRLAEVCGVLNVAHGSLVDLVAEALETQAFGPVGHPLARALVVVEDGYLGWSVPPDRRYRPSS